MQAPSNSESNTIIKQKESCNNARTTHQKLRLKDLQGYLPSNKVSLLLLVGGAEGSVASSQ